jgi:hypothetical protein
MRFWPVSKSDLDAAENRIIAALLDVELRLTTLIKAIDPSVNSRLLAATSTLSANTTKLNDAIQKSLSETLSQTLSIPKPPKPNKH